MGGEPMSEATASVRCGIVGLGYVGLNLAELFTAAGYRTVGYDIDRAKVTALQEGRDPTGEFPDGTFADRPIEFSDTPSAIGDCEFVFVAVPSPLDDRSEPDISALEAASETVGEHLAEDAIVVYESTLYPGTTREELRPALERGAARQGSPSFGVGYSPERIVPGSAGKPAAEITKLVSAEDGPTRDRLQALFAEAVAGEVHPTATIEVAEAAKCLENIQRDVNIALVNEFTMGARQLEFDLDPYAVLEAAGTKWSFHDYRPGIVGGHCIPVDPHYLRYRFEEAGFEPAVLASSRRVNERMRSHVATVTADALESAGKHVPPAEEGLVRSDGSGPLSAPRLLLLGLAYKPNVSDLRNSPAFGVADELQEAGIEVVGHDPLADAEVAADSFEFEIQPTADFEGCDGVAVLTPHDELRSLDLEAAAESMADDPVFVDVGNAFDQDAVTAAGFSYRRP